MEFRRLSVILLLVLVICNVQAQDHEYHTSGDQRSQINPQTPNKSSDPDKERPTAVASIDPDPQVFVGETVTLTCDIKGGGVYRWRYSWNEEGSKSIVSDAQVYRISYVTASHAGKYTCTVTETGGSRYSHTSDAVTLTVSDKPTATVSVSPQSSVYTGDTVTLNCEVHPYVGWTYQLYWYRSDAPLTTWTEIAKNTKTISQKAIALGSIKYACMAHRGNFSTYYRDVEITVTERPTAVASIKPDTQVFVGETVTLTCDIKGGDVYWWWYSWKKEGSYGVVSVAQVYRISDVTESHTGKYTCRGTEDGGSRYSHTSDAVTLTVSERPTAVASIEPDPQVFDGETVTLTCDIKGGGDTRWQYSWMKRGSDSLVSSVQEYTISYVTESDTGKYTCRGTFAGGSRYSHTSDAVTLTVSERPTAVASIKPDSHVFVGETVTLRCTIDGGGATRWQYSWNEEGSYRHVHSSQVFTVSPVTKSHAGKYTCSRTFEGGSRYSHTSNAVTLTVSDKPTATVSVSPQSSVYTGDTVTLNCEVHPYVGWTFQLYWYRSYAPLTMWTEIAKNTKTINQKAIALGSIKYACMAQRGNFSTYYRDVEITVTERPTAVVSIKPGPQVFVGETVTLTCDIKGGDVYWWWYSWKKEGSYGVVSIDQEYRISYVRKAHTGKYTCNGTEDGGSRYSHTSAAVTLTVSERPTAVASIDPDPQVFVGETVTLTCDIKGGGATRWQYSWMKDSPASLVSHEQVYTVNDVKDYHTGKYTCRGTFAGGSRYSHTSDAVTLTVSAVKPKPELTSSLQGAALIGNPVTLYCKLEQSAGWRFYWSKHTQNPDNETSTETSSTTISSVMPSDGGQYWCRAGRGNPVYYTHYSDALWVNVTGVSSLVSLIISPNRSQHFSGHSLSLSCEDQSHSTAWTVMKYTQNRSVSDCSSGWGSVTGSTCTISSLSISHTGVYWCQSESAGSNNAVNITVHDGDVILDSPVHPVTEGDSLTLRCLCSQTPSNLTASFYKDGSPFQTQTTGQITIRAVSKSDEGLYYCKYPEGGESPHSWVSVRGSGSSDVPVGLIVGLCLTLLFIILLILLWSFKKNKGSGSPSPPTGRQQNTSQSCSGPGSSLSGPSLLQPGSDHVYANVGNRISADNTSTGPLDGTYALIELKNFRRHSRDDGAGPSDVIYAEIEIQTDNAGPSVVTYADIEVKAKKKPKRTGKTREASGGACTLYSELTQTSANGL
ncbi:basement membrane-specific heparan sulfate proteoglycan core protein-like isoform X1 [Brachyhypopomus gauderio]|uniref:basement membrane-specific heparan sulfate proteoglycan core protein-like isoform X1 n=1 Tax=Brachyhypopomus gauderio TaxID=698409 RepID=UPI0040434D40